MAHQPAVSLFKLVHSLLEASDYHIATDLIKLAYSRSIDAVLEQLDFLYSISMALLTNLQAIISVVVP